METFSHKQADRGALISIVAYIFLSAVKIGVSFAAASSALRADGLNNLTDIGASLAVYIGLKISQKPRDSDHPYGHSRAEQIASLVASFIMMSVGIEVILQAGQSFFQERAGAPGMLAAWVALFCAVIMYGVYFYTRNLAKQTRSKALEAAAKDNLSDALVGVGTFTGVVASQFGMPIIDPIAAIIVGGVICKTAWDIFSEASHMLTDGINPEKMDQFIKTVQSVDGVNEVVDMRARMYGNEAYVDITITVDGQLDVLESHRIADEVEDKMLEEHGVTNSHIHIEPSESPFFVLK
ncbi:cation diffusion facilitator family transporter [Ectobacillus panaciterrae]|uniref:cation diffusion facilitator family transporter n=1 Tax=Ectobacillus panaciterrae TaxID=363872 RepID=UPI0003F7AA46|nr:cation diffusion facilitator family transporter [Ectobacillus panaciterrae]